MDTKSMALLNKVRDGKPCEGCRYNTDEYEGNLCSGCPKGVAEEEEGSCCPFGDYSCPVGEICPDCLLQ